MGEKFSGTYYLTRVTHRFDDGGYLCEFEAKRNAISRAALEEMKGTEELAAQGYGVGGE